MGAISLTTGGGIDLNDQTNYFLIDFQPGPEVRDEAWIEPWAATSPTLAGYAVRKTQAIVVVTIKAASVAAVRTKVNNVRDEFNAQASTLRWNPGDVGKTMTTYPSAIPSPLVGQALGLYVLNSQFILENWTIPITRAPFYNDGSLPVI